MNPDDSAQTDRHDAVPKAGAEGMATQAGAEGVEAQAGAKDIEALARAEGTEVQAGAEGMAAQAGAESPEPRLEPADLPPDGAAKVGRYAQISAGVRTSHPVHRVLAALDRSGIPGLRETERGPLYRVFAEHRATRTRARTLRRAERQRGESTVAAAAAALTESAVAAPVEGEPIAGSAPLNPLAGADTPRTGSTSSPSPSPSSGPMLGSWYTTGVAVSLSTTIVLAALIASATAVPYIMFLVLGPVPLLPLLGGRQHHIAVSAVEDEDGATQVTAHGEANAESAAAVEVFLESLPTFDAESSAPVAPQPGAQSTAALTADEPS